MAVLPERAISSAPAVASSPTIGSAPVIDPSGRLPYAITQRIIYRKVNQQQVVNTISETDLFAGEAVVGASVLGPNGLLQIVACGDLINNSGANRDVPRFKLKFGATTLLDTNVLGGTNWNANANRTGWSLTAWIQNLGVVNSQWARIGGTVVFVGSGTTAQFFATGSGITQATGDVMTFEGGNSGALDTTTAQPLQLTVTLPFASATLDVTLRAATVELI